MIPEDTDVLITHGPPHMIGDECPDGFRAGCEDLLERVKVVKPKVHVFGHIHGGHGVYNVDGTKFINASVLDESYNRTQDPITIEL